MPPGRGESCGDRRAARSITDRTDNMCSSNGTLDAAGEHGIDMSLRNENVSAASLAFGVHCSVFKKRFPDRRAKGAPLRRDTHPRHFLAVV